MRGRCLLAALLGGSALIWSAVPAAAAAPANDAFAAANPLTVGADVSSSNVDATVEAGELDPTGNSASYSCSGISAGGNCGASVWYSFEAPSTGQYTIDLCDGATDFNAIIGVYTGSLGSLVLKEAKGNSGPNCPEIGDNFGEPQLTFSATAGTIYHVDITGTGGAQGSFYLRAYAGTAKAPPAPDTAVFRHSSLAAELNAPFGGTGAISGPRRSGSFALVANAPGATFECSLDGAAFTACDSAVSYDALAPGSSHVFQARAVLAGVSDPTPATERFTIDTAPPDTSILSGPSGPLASQSAKWTYGASERYNRDSFACGLDSERTFACSNGQTYQQLCAGPHTFHVAALDYAANIDPTPATASFQVTTGPACAAPTVSPSSSVVATATGALLHIPYDDKGAAGRIHIEYGPTTSYGMETEDTRAEPVPATETKASIVFMAPSTLYHYRVTLTTPFGTASTADQTVTTTPASTTLPTIVNGAPRVAGEHAAAIPATIDSGSESSALALYIEPGAAASAGSPRLQLFQSLFGGSGPQPVVAGVTDLEPATTYHYRFAADQQNGGGEVLGPEGTFTTPPFPAKAHFTLKRRQVKVGKLKPKTKALTIKLNGLPDGSAIKADLSVGKKKKKHARKSGKIKAGKLTMKVKLTRKFRDALLGEGKAKLTVTATPPGDTASSIHLIVKLQKPHKPRKHH